MAKHYEARRVGMSCGFAAAEFILTSLGKQFIAALPKNILHAATSPTTPHLLAAMLSESGQPAEPVKLTHAERLDFLRREVEKGKPVAILARVKAVFPHWYVVHGVEESKVRVYDSRTPHTTPEIHFAELAWWTDSFFSRLFPTHCYDAVICT